MMRVSPEVRALVMQVAAKDYNGATADETLRRLVDEHWERAALAGVDAYQREDPSGYAGYVQEITGGDLVGAPALDAWDAGKAAA